ncbi:MAG: hypothetical protein V9G19_06265 [Tetrasphaera sp.]
MSTISKRTLLSAVTTVGALGAIAASSVPAGAASQGSKPVPAPPTSVDRSILATEAAAGARVSTPANGRAAETLVRKRIAAYVAKHGTTYSFASYLDVSTGKVVVESDAPAALVAKLTDLSGQRAAAGARITTTSTGTDDLYSRRDDVAPFYGGGGIRYGGGLCSSGYTIIDSAGFRYMVTAGHCFPVNAAVTTESGANAYGTMVARVLPNNGGGPRDMGAIYGASYSYRIFTGGVWSASSLPVVGAGDAVQGYANYCHSGRATGERCGHRAANVNAQVCTNTGCKYPVVALKGGTMAKAGDSGAPYYVKDSSNVWIRGHVIAGNRTTTFAEKWGKVAAYWGVTIATS